MLNRIDPGRERYKELAKELRERQTPSEQILWKHLRAKRYNGCKFRRQVPIGPYIADFMCVGAKLIIEVDGNSHWQSRAQEYDRVRDGYLKSWGFTVVRFGNSEILKNLKSVLTRIDEHLHPSP